MFRMEVDKLLPHTQYALPVGFVLILAALVFVFGFKTVSEPKFSDRYAEEKKAKKQAKPKDKPKKVQSNGQANIESKAVRDKRSSDDEKVGGSSPAKSVKKEAPKKQVPEKKMAEAAEIKKPVAMQKVKAPVTPKANEVKPEDFDDGEWVQAVNKKDRKSRRSELQTPEVAAQPVAAANVSGKKKAKATKEEKKDEQAKPVEEPIQIQATEEAELKIAEVPPVQAATVIVEEAAPKDMGNSTPVEEIIMPEEPADGNSEESKPVDAESKSKSKASKSQTKKAPKKGNKETNNNENAIVSKKDTAKETEEVVVKEDVVEPVKEVAIEPVKEVVVEPVKEVVIEPVKEVTPVDISPANEPTAEDTWQEIQAPKKKKKARRE